MDLDSGAMTTNSASNRWSDRDLFMRYLGGAVGHANTHETIDKPLQVVEDDPALLSSTMQHDTTTANARNQPMPQHSYRSASHTMSPATVPSPPIMAPMSHPAHEENSEESEDDDPDGAYYPSSGSDSSSEDDKDGGDEGERNGSEDGDNDGEPELGPEDGEDDVEFDGENEVGYAQY